MLEWYRKNARYERIMQDVAELIRYALEEGKSRNFPLRFSKTELVKKTMQDLFSEELGIDILDYLDVTSIKYLLKRYPDVLGPDAELEGEEEVGMDPSRV